MIRHAGSSTADLRTTLILLCEDGSLRIYMASVDHTNFWMVPTMQPGVSLAVEGGTSKVERKKKLTQTGKLFVLRQTWFLSFRVCRVQLTVKDSTVLANPSLTLLLTQTAVT